MRRGLERSLFLAPLMLLLLPLEHLLLLLLLRLLLLLLLLLLLVLLRLLSAALLLQLPPCLVLPLLLLFFPLLLLEGAKTSRPGRPPHVEGSRHLLIHRADIPRRLVAARCIANSDGILLDPRSGRLGGSLLPLGLGDLDPCRRRRD